MSRRGTSVGLLLAGLCGALVLLMPTGVAQAAGTVTVTLSRGGPSSPKATVGDAVTFQNKDDVDHVVASSTDNWSFAQTTVKPGATFAVRRALAAAGTYGFTDTLPVGPVPIAIIMATGTVTASAAPAPAPVPGGQPATPAPTGPSSGGSAGGGAGSPGGGASGAGSTGPTPRAAPGGSTGSAASPRILSTPGTAGMTGSTGGRSGIAVQPRLDTGSLLLPTPLTNGVGPAPQVAPTLPANDAAVVLSQNSPAAGLGTATDTSPQSGGPQLTDTLSLPQPPSLRRYGIPSVLGVVLALGVASLLVRVALAAAPAAAVRRRTA